jgi:hypothetical protein
MSTHEPTGLRAVVIPTGSEPATVVTIPAEQRLASLQDYVGGYIEAVDVSEVLTDNGRRRVACSIFLNEEGKMQRLPVNARATDLAAITIGGWRNDVIVGQVVVTGQPDGRGETTDVPEDVVKIISDWGWFS